MILCIDTTVLKTSPDVQKDVNLEELINSHTKYYDSEEDAIKDKFVPLDFSVSVRSVYSNLVLQIDSGDEKRYYINLTKIQPFVHKGYDLIMYLTSIGLMYNINYRMGFDDLMMKHSQFQPIGLYNPDPSIINPIIYTHIIMSDESIKLFNYLKADRKFVDITTMRQFSKGNIIALLDTLIEVKEETPSEK